MSVVEPALDVCRHTCPRRVENPTPRGVVENTDVWHGRRGLAGHGPVGPCCSYCGSLHPDRFMELVRQGWIVGPTDKDYKVYLSRPYTDEEKAERKARWLVEPDGVARAIRDVGERDGKAPDQIEADIERHWDGVVSRLQEVGAEQVKFYYMHLSSQQRAEFIALHNSGELVVGYPGHLYVAPFFARRSGA